MDGSGLLPMSCTTVMDEYSIRNLLSNVAMLQDKETQRKTHTHTHARKQRMHARTHTHKVML